MRFLTIVALSLLALSSVAPLPAAADQAGATVTVTTLEASYGDEGWKDASATPLKAGASLPVPALPAGYTGVYDNPYKDPARRYQGPGANWWGYTLDAQVTVKGADGTLVLDAWIDAAQGRLPVKLAKVNATTFHLQADLDGENDKSYPVLTDGGPYNLVMEVYQTTDPTVRPQKVASNVHTVHLSRGAVNGPSGILFPEANLPGYDDVSPTNYTTLHMTNTPPGKELTARFRFPGAAHAPAVVQLVNGDTATVVHEGTTNGQGHLEATFQPGAALGMAESGLLLLTAHLTGANDTLGAAAVALPVTPHAMEITSMRHEARPPIADEARRELSTVQVVARDPNPDPANSSKRGELFLTRGVETFATANFNPTDFAGGEHRSARYPVDAVESRGLTNYGLVALFFNEQDQFYSVASAHRGAAISIDGLTTTVQQRSALRLTLQNLNNNFNGAPDAGLATTVHVRVTGLPGGDVHTDEITLDEAMAGVVEVPWTASQVGTHDVTVNATAGEISLGYDVTATVTERPGPLDIDRIRETVPAPGAALLLGALLVAALFATVGRYDA